MVGLSVLRRDDTRGFHKAIVPSCFPSPWPTSVPSVFIGTPLDQIHGPTFSTDNRQVARIAAEHLREDLHVSRQYLSQCFVKHVGRSVKAEVDRVRIELIREALQNAKSSPKQLAMQMGFSDPSQFSRFCRRRLGHSPRSIPKRDTSFTDTT